MRDGARRTSIRQGFLLVAAFLIFPGCATEPVPGPDKQGGGQLAGIATGLGAGAVTGFQIGAGTGAGALVGAGVGAVAGGLQGAAQDWFEEDMLRLAVETSQERRRAIVHEVLAEHYRRKAELHPSRDIFPADLFFYGDTVRLRPGADMLVYELARMNKERLPWSRMEVVAYIRTADKDAPYARHLAERRSREIADYLVRGGMEPRRVIPKAVFLTEPLVVDRLDSPDRFNQSIELVAADR